MTDPSRATDPRGPTAAAVARAYERFAAHGDPAVAIAMVPREAAMAAARELDARAPDGRAALPLAAMPFAVKDNIDVAGTPTTAGCPGFAYTPSASAAVVQRLCAAGAVPVAKTNLDQFATGLVGTRSPYGTPRNPVAPDRVPGGSSSGSAVAVAAGLVPFALGTDTAGSGRVPAAFTGIVGLKPTRGAVSTRGIVPAVASLDCPSIFARTVADAWTVYTACRGFEADDLSTHDLGRDALGATPGPHAPRVGVLDPAAIAGTCDGPAAAAYRDAVAGLERLGYATETFDARPFLDSGRLLYDGPWVAQRYAAVGAFLEAHGADPGVDPVVARIILEARDRTAVDAYEGAERLAAFERGTAATWSRVDVLAVPTTPAFPTLAEVAADPVGVNARLGTFTAFVNLLDLCAISVPGPARPDGLPAGVTLIGRRGADALVATVGARVHGEPGEVVAPAPGATIELVVVGAHLRGQPLNHQLTDAGRALRRRRVHRAVLPPLRARGDFAAQARAGPHRCRRPPDRGRDVGPRPRRVRALRGPGSRPPLHRDGRAGRRVDAEGVPLRARRPRRRGRHHPPRRLAGLPRGGVTGLSPFALRSQPGPRRATRAAQDGGARRRPWRSVHSPRSTSRCRRSGPTGTRIGAVAGRGTDANALHQVD